MKPIRVIFQARSDVFKSPGGDTIQLLKTKEGLERLGVSIDVSLEYSPDLKAYDLVHIFNITRVHESFLQAQNAKKQGKPLVLSPIYWNMSEYTAYARQFSFIKRILGPFLDNERVKFKLASVRDFLRGVKLDEALKQQRKMGFKRQQVDVLSMADMWMPNAYVEHELLVRDFNIDKPVKIVPNGADKRFADANSRLFIDKYGFNDFILAVGNMSIRKNFLNLIRALRGSGLKLVIIGRLETPERRYARLCCREAERNGVLLIDQLDQDMLASAYAAAKVHVLPSWYETPGLASLEAALAGCNIVTTEKGSTREYFGDLAWYCDPANIDSIRTAVIQAYHAPKSTALKEIVMINYTWERSASLTLEGYRALLC